MATGCSGTGTTTSRPDSGRTAPATTATASSGSTPVPSTTRTRSATETEADELAAKFPQTAAGAEAFVRAYFDALSRAFAAGDPAGLSDYSTPACLRCEGFLRTLTGDHDHGRHGVGTFALIHRVTPTAVTTTSAVVDVESRMGLGERRVALPLERLKIDSDRLVLDMTAECTASTL